METVTAEMWAQEKAAVSAQVMAVESA